MYHDRNETYRKTALTGLLEALCSSLEISTSRLAQAKDRYLGVANWLTEGDHWMLATLTVYLQGSMALGTTVRPIGSEEHDVDLVGFMPNGRTDHHPGRVADMVGERLGQNGHYAKLLSRKNRCWRLTYANEFHLDITPAIPDPTRLGAELVPDKALTVWKETNPRGYRAFFEACATLTPRLRAIKAYDEARGAKADSIEPFPAMVETRSLLCRIVQVAKRHRDVAFSVRPGETPPISVILTTLAAWSYERCVGTQVFDTEFDVIIAVLRGMPDFIQQRLPDGRHGWFIPNPSTFEENFAERWNEDPRRATSFFNWHRRAVADIEALGDVEGLDTLQSRMQAAFGDGPVAKAFGALSERVNSARTDGSLRVAASVGLTVASLPKSYAMPANRFYGRPA